MSNIIVPKRGLILPKRFKGPQRQHGFIMNPFAHDNSNEILFSNVRLLCHANGADGSPTLVDSSSYARTLTRQGTAEIDTAQSVFGGASAYIPASTNGWTCPSDASLDMRAGAFLIEWRHRLAANMSSTSQNDAVLAMVNGDSWQYEWSAVVQRNYLYFYYGRRGFTSGGIRWLLPGGYDFNTLGGTFVPCAIGRDASGDWGAWLYGQRCTQYQYAPQAPSPTWSPVNTATYNSSVDFGASGARTLNIGRFYTYSGLAVEKHIDELRYVTGQCRDTASNYTPDVTPFPDS